MDLPSFEFGTVHSKFKGFQYQNTQNELSGKISGSAGWPGSILATKEASHFCF
jgi:hypothetical protein